MKSLLLRIFWVFSLSCFTGTFAAVVPLNIKTIFHPGITEQRITLVNRNDENPVILESWVNDGSNGVIPESVEYPFVVIPPVLKLATMEVKNLRVMITQKAHDLPSDKESLFFLNLYEIPGIKSSESTASESQRVKIGLNSQLKIIYRPVADPHSWQEVLNKLEFDLIKTSSQEYALQIRNTTPYFVTPLNISLITGNKTTDLLMPFDRDVKPFADRSFPIPHWNGSTPTRIKIAVSDDNAHPAELDKAWSAAN